MVKKKKRPEKSRWPGGKNELGKKRDSVGRGGRKNKERAHAGAHVRAACVARAGRDPMDGAARGEKKKKRGAMIRVKTRCYEMQNQHTVAWPCFEIDTVPFRPLLGARGRGGGGESCARRNVGKKESRAHIESIAIARLAVLTFLRVLSCIRAATCFCPLVALSQPSVFHCWRHRNGSSDGSTVRTLFIRPAGRPTLIDSREEGRNYRALFTRDTSKARGWRLRCVHLAVAMAARGKSKEMRNVYVRNAK